MKARRRKIFRKQTRSYGSGYSAAATLTNSRTGQRAQRLRENLPRTGGKLFGLCENGQAHVRRASQQKCSGITASSVSLAARLLMLIKSRSRWSCCHGQTLRNEIAKRINRSLLTKQTE